MKRVVDLFAGTGAFSYVFHNKGYNVVFANDFTKESQNIYELNNNPESFHHCDLNDIINENIPPHDILCGGFPCQPFSIAGKQEGFQDPRSNVFWKILEILKYHKPNIIILENVKNLTTHNNGHTYYTIIQELKNIGYNTLSKVLDTCKITNIPQHRERIYIVGFLDKNMFNTFNLDFPIIQQNIDIIHLLETDIPDKYYYTNKFKVFDVIQNNVTKHISENIVYQYRRNFVRKNKSYCCPTLTANMGSGGHNVPIIKDDKGIRKLTPRECFNLQGFPCKYNLPNLADSLLYKLAGNAVSLPVIELIINKLAQL